MAMAGCKVIEPNSKASTLTISNVKKPCSISIFHQNIQYLATRIDSLIITIEELKPQIVILTEHKLNQNEIMKLKIPGFQVATWYARTDFGGGGVLILVSEKIDFKNLAVNSLHALNQDKIFESCITEIKVGKEKLLVVGLYRTPSEDAEIYLDKLNELLRILNKMNRDILLGGDFNINVLKKDKKKRS